RQPRLLRAPAPAFAQAWIPAADVLNGAVPRARLQGRIVLLGSLLPETGQSVDLPDGGRLASVQWHALALAELLDGRTLRSLPPWLQLLLGMLAVQLPLLWPRRLRWRGTRWPALLAPMALPPLLAWALLAWGWWWPPLAPVLVLAIGLAAAALLAGRRTAQRLRSDPETGLVDRERFAILLARAARRAARAHRPLALLLLETRTDPSAGDPHERAAGAIAHALQAWATCPGDVAARLDGGRFALLLPRTGHFAAAVLLAALQAELAGQRAPPLRSGLAELTGDDPHGSDLLLRATRDLVAARARAGP
ncbi:MAG: CHASE2 domain-containing protein, partial [Pseudoxanthomonas sp.]